MAKKTNKKNKQAEQLQRDKVLTEKGNGILRESAHFAYNQGVKMSEKILAGEVEIPPFDDAELFKYQIQKLDEYFIDLQQKTRMYPTCKEGCSHCCSYPIWVSEFEFEAISSWIEENIEEETKEKIKGNLREWKEKIGEIANRLQSAHAAANFWALAQNQRKTKEAETNKDELKKGYSEQRVSCPFLIDNSCSIYESRPVTCRTYFAYGSPERCKKEVFPIGTLDFACAERNIFFAPLFNMVKVLSGGDESIRQQHFRKTGINYKLFPLWFSGE